MATAAVKTARIFTEKDLKSLKVLQRFREVFEQVVAEHPEWVHRSFDDPKRRLLLGDYLGLVLLALYNPVARSLRALAKASRWPKLSRRAGIRDGASQPGQFFRGATLGQPRLALPARRDSRSLPKSCRI